MASISQSKRYIAMDVECVATGIRHNARDVCSVAVVDTNEKVLFSKKVKPEKPVVSYLTPLTGVRKEDLDNGEKLSDVIAEVKALLGPDIVLVGQRVDNDIEWLHLKQGADYGDSVDLAEIFKAYNPRYNNTCYFTLSHEANTLIQSGFISLQHNPENDAIASIKLFNKYYGNSALIQQARQKLLRIRPPKSFAKRNDYRYEGVCMAAYFPAKCFCGAPTKV